MTCAGLAFSGTLEPTLAGIGTPAAQYMPLATSESVPASPSKTRTGKIRDAHATPATP